MHERNETLNKTTNASILLFTMKNNVQNTKYKTKKNNREPLNWRSE